MSEPEKYLYAAWLEATRALGPTQRLVMWQDNDGPVYIQVTAPDEQDEMVPVLTELAAYPSKGFGSITAGLRNITERLAA